MKTTPITSQNLQQKMTHNEDLKKLEALRLDIAATTATKKVKAKKLLEKQAQEELDNASILFDDDNDNVVEYTTEKVKHARRTYDKKTTPIPTPTPPLTYDDKTRGNNDEDDNGKAPSAITSDNDNVIRTSTSTSTSTSIGDNDNKAHTHDNTPLEKVSQGDDDNTLMTTPTPDNEKVSQSQGQGKREKVSRDDLAPSSLTITDPNGHPLPLEVLLDKHNINYQRLPMWFLQVMGSLSLTNLEKYVHLMGDDLPITERIAADLLNRVVSGDKEATKIYWDLQKNLAKNPKIIQQNNISVKTDNALENAFKAIEAEVLDTENKA